VEKPTDWLRLWEELVRVQEKDLARRKGHHGGDPWKHRARDFDRMVKKRWDSHDSSREFIVSALKSNPGSTVLDIGAGTGSWALLLAKHAASVTALEPSEAMTEMLIENMEAEGIDNITVVDGRWPDVSTAPHDYVLASHSVYGASDFRTFVLKMRGTARRACFLLLRVPFVDAIMARAAMHVWGQPHDSPNFQIAYNALLQIGIYPNVVMESPRGWRPWENKSFDEALAEVKSRLDIWDRNQYDEYLTALLEQELKEENGRVVWPAGNQSALVYWDV